MYNKQILALTLTLTLTLTDTGGAVLTLMLGYRKFKTNTGPKLTITLPYDTVVLCSCTFCSDRRSVSAVHVNTQKTAKDVFNSGLTQFGMTIYRIGQRGTASRGTLTKCSAMELYY